MGEMEGLTTDWREPPTLAWYLCPRSRVPVLDRLQQERLKAR
ncbi:hypothetical protein BX264_3822 [Streptomyces sp. 2333.5]|nr:hypothetical protein BX264_3822 [Streptomyces sp. 2333.5]SED40723.1 hypothetical protein SAMN05428943_3556 [Streptomyces sp. 2314.4]SEE45544.1 hypothetical protein SAMN05428942_3924 [Streptomyces sp. 2112.2]